MSGLSTAPGSRRMPNLNPLTAKQLRDADRDKVYIYNVSTRRYRAEALGRLWEIPACPIGAMVSEPLVIPGVCYTTAVKKVSGMHVEYEWVGTDGLDVARDIVGTAPFKDASENLTPYGVFIAEGIDTGHEEVAKARDAWHATCGEKVRNADQLWAVNKGMVSVMVGGVATAISNIGEDAKEAAKILNLDREWAEIEGMKIRCDECGVANMSTASRCKECHAIFDEAKARKSYPQMFSEEKRGRPKNEVAA